MMAIKRLLWLFALFTISVLALLCGIGFWLSDSPPVATGLAWVEQSRTVQGEVGARAESSLAIGPLAFSTRGDVVELQFPAVAKGPLGSIDVDLWMTNEGGRWRVAEAIMYPPDGGHVFFRAPGFRRNAAAIGELPPAK